MAEPLLAESAREGASRTPRAEPSAVPPLIHGERLDRSTFHRRYLAAPPRFRAELIQGVVFASSRVGLPHAEHHMVVMTWLGVYLAHTPGVRGSDNGTVLLDDESEFQPDAALFIDPALGGQARVENDVLVGAPELVVEIAESSVEHDLRSKRLEYEEAGVREYVVVNLKKQRVHWFERSGDFFKPLEPEADGILRSRVFPGLRLDPVALIGRDMARVLTVLNQGLDQADHLAFIDRLRARSEAAETA